MANLNDALQRNNPVFSKSTFCQVVAGSNDTYPDQGTSPSNDITNPLQPYGSYCIISNQTDKEIELITMDTETGLPGGTAAHATRLGIPIGAEANLMMAFGSQTKAYIKLDPTRAAASRVVLTWFAS